MTTSLETAAGAPSPGGGTFPRPCSLRRRLARAAFTLVEILVATVVLIIILGVVFSITGEISRLWKGTSSKISAFQGARAAFDALTRNLSQATLNQYYDYYDASWMPRTPLTSTTFVPANYGRRSELEYVSGTADHLFGSNVGDKVTHAAFFQAPLGRVASTANQMESGKLLNAVGYYVEFGGASKYGLLPIFLRSQTQADRKAFRLVEWVQPSENLHIYDAPPTTLGSWFISSVNGGTQSHVLAENAVALVIFPRSAQTDNALAPKYFYDSNPLTDDDVSNYDPLRSHLLPPLLQITLVAIDDDSATRLRGMYGDTAPPLTAGLFQQAAQYNADLATLENLLNGAAGKPRLNYRVFTTTVRTHETK